MNHVHLMKPLRLLDVMSRMFTCGLSYFNVKHQKSLVLFNNPQHFDVMHRSGNQYCQRNFSANSITVKVIFVDRDNDVYHLDCQTGKLSRQQTGSDF